MIDIILNGKKIKAKKGQTILEVANENGVEIPTLCHDKELNPFGSCWVCAVKVVGKKGFVTACGTEITPNMEVETNSKEVYNARKMALELLLSDHYADCEAPCMIACPDNVDVQAYVTAIANKQYHEAVRIIKDKLPMPLSIGRVCPAFCEKECRRTLVDEPIAIRQLKRYAADKDLNDYWQWVPQKAETTGKKVAIVGAGPSGLSCGYYLSYQGYEVDVYETAPKAGGWLRYGIPEYRLPKEILDKEIELMCLAGMKIYTNKEIGKTLGISHLSGNYDAVYLAIGAQKAVGMPLKGVNLKGVYLGVDYLKSVALGNVPTTGKKTAVIGGGNTAIDCARTALRLGSEVTIIYRRTRQEMPAEELEIIAAEEEGVNFMMLSNPVEYHGKESLSSVSIEKMKLGEPDSSGRRRPVGTGEIINLEFDTVIAAISQIPDVSFLSEDINKINEEILPLTKWSTAEVNEQNMFTGIKNIFAGGDFRRGPATAIEAIADGRIAAENIDMFLQGKEFADNKKRFDSKKEKLLNLINPEHYAQYEKVDRVKMQELSAEIRNKNFEEVELGFTDIEAISEAKRCLECSCKVNETCQLRKYATEYEVDIETLTGDKNVHPIDDSHPFIKRDPNKCIKCGRCVRICSEVQGAGVLGFMFRGFVTNVAPEFGESLTNTTCESCGKCIAVCPVGALTAKHIYKKSTHLRGDIIYQNCALCGTGCKIQIDVNSNSIREISEPQEEKELSFNDRNLCYYGRFGWQIFEDEKRITSPQIKKNDKWEKATYSELKGVIYENYLKFDTRFAFVSAEASLEEMLIMKHIESNKNFKLYSAINNIEPFKNICRTNFDNFSYDILNSAENIVIFANVNSTIRTLCRSAQRNGSKLYLINPQEDSFDYSEAYLRFADEIFRNKSDDIFKGIREKLSEKTIIIYNNEGITVTGVRQIWEFALSKCDITNGYGVFMTSSFANYRGLCATEIPYYGGSINEESMIICYKHPVVRPNNKSFVIEFNTIFDQDSDADIFIPCPSYLEIDGTYLSDSNEINLLGNPKKSNLLHLILNLLYETKLISPAYAEPSLWNLKTQEYLETLQRNELSNDELLKLLDIIKDDMGKRAVLPEYYKLMDNLK